LKIKYNLNSKFIIFATFLKIPKTIHNHSKKIPKTFQEHSKKIPKRFQKLFIKISTTFQKHFNNIPKHSKNTPKIAPK